MSNQKRYKNERQKAAQQKRDGTREFGLPDPAPRDLEARRAAFLQRKTEAKEMAASKPRWNRKPPSPQPLPQSLPQPWQPPPPPRDDSQMHIKALPEAEHVRVYRVEVQSFNTQYPHVHVHADGSRADLYTAGKPDQPSDWYTVTDHGGGVKSYASAVGKGKKTPARDDPDFTDKFLGSRKDQPSGNRGFYNFGEPDRALHFYDQKSSNPSEQARGNVFQIKSFLVPHDIFQRVADDSVHEKDAASHPHLPINVDRAAPNQFGLPQPYVSLIEARQISGSAQVEDPEALRERLAPPSGGRPVQWRGAPSSLPDPHWASKGAEQHDIRQEVHEARFGPAEHFE